MRKAEPDDVLQFVSPQQLADLWPSVDRYLGKSREFWAWLLEKRNCVDTSSGEDLSSAVANAPRRDSGFSPLTLAWVLRDWNVRKVARSAGLSDADAESLERFRQSLVDYLITLDPIA